MEIGKFCEQIEDPTQQDYFKNIFPKECEKFGIPAEIVYKWLSENMLTAINTFMRVINEVGDNMINNIFIHINLDLSLTKHEFNFNFNGSHFHLCKEQNGN